MQTQKEDILLKTEERSGGTAAVLPEQVLDSDTAATYDGKTGAYRTEDRKQAQSNTVQVSSVMICGRVSLISDEELKKASATCRMVVVGEGHDALAGKYVRVYKTTPYEDQFSQLFDAHDIDTVWYISGFADGSDGMKDEMKYLEGVMKACSAGDVSKLVVVSSVESMNFQRKYDETGRLTRMSYASGRAFTAAQMEEYVRFWSESTGLKTIILRAPYIANKNGKDTFLGSLMDGILEGKTLEFPYSPENKVDFLSDADLMTLLLNVSEEGADRTASFNVTSGYHCTWQDLETNLRSLESGTTVSYSNEQYFIAVQNYSFELKRQYGFIPVDNVMDLLGEIYYARKEERSRRHPVREFMKKAGQFLRNNVVRYIELLLLFALTEFLVEKTGAVIYFRYVDLRLFFVLIMGTTYGISTGVLGGLLAGAALFLQYKSQGVNGTMLFYNLENWLPFVVYLMTGSVTGYLSDVRRQEYTFLQKEFEILREKYMFLSDVYRSAVENKGKYKQQILSYKDSFGVIFRAVQRLDSVMPQEIYMNGILIMEDILQNHSIAIFSLDDWQRFGRLTVCSGEMLQELPKSVEIAAYQPVYETVKSGEIWKNTELIPGMPMYAYGIGDGSKVDLMVFIYRAAPEQMSLYYLNLFSILCNLIRLSFVRALSYQRAIEREKYYPDTLVVVPAYFEETLRAQKNLAEAGLASFCLIRFDSKDRQLVSDSLQKVIRSSDIIGSEEDGTLYLLLTQANRDTMTIVGKRLEKTGLEFEIVSGT